MITEYQNSVIVGSLLGDLHIQKSDSKVTPKCRLRFCHGLEQKKYVDWKYRIFQENFCKSTKSPYQTDRNEYLFYTTYSDFFVEYHSTWYQPTKRDKDVLDISGASKEELLLVTKTGFEKKKLNKKWVKVVPPNIEHLLIDPIALAIWYLDDGTKRDYNACRFATQSFSLEENKFLQSTLETNFNLTVKIEEWWNKKTNKKMPGLSIPSANKSFLTFKDIIYNFVKTEIPSMLYKLE